MTYPPSPHSRPRDGLIRAFTEDHPAGKFIASHSHARGQLIFPDSGTLRLETENGLWAIPPGRAVWVPAGVCHTASYSRRSVVHGALFDISAHPDLPLSCAIFTLTSLLRELVLRLIDLGPDHRMDDRSWHVAQTLLDEVCHHQPLGPYLPFGTDPRLRRVTEALKEDPSNIDPIDIWADHAATSARTLARLFTDETGLSFSRWREQLRLIISIARLAEGESITRVAHEMGYSSAGAFSTMFTRALGKSPRAYRMQMLTIGA